MITFRKLPTDHFYIYKKNRWEVVGMLTYITFVFSNQKKKNDVANKIKLSFKMQKKKKLQLFFFSLKITWIRFQNPTKLLTRAQLEMTSSSVMDGCRLFLNLFLFYYNLNDNLFIFNSRNFLFRITKLSIKTSKYPLHVVQLPEV